MQRKLAEIDLGSEDISERLIRLGCGHIFTVETLDVHCDLWEYYQIDTMGVVLATKAPPVNYQTPPSCPTCRGPITALRYGRVTKGANLHILELNVAGQMSSELDEISKEVETFSAKLEDVKYFAKKISFTPSKKKPEDLYHLAEDRKTKFGEESEPLPPDAIQQGAMTTIHGFSEEESKAWYEIVREIVKLYRKVAGVARIRGPHAQAYGAVLETLYRLELAGIPDDQAGACDKSELSAMEEVNKKTEHPPHRAYTRFQVEGFFVSIELRYTLAEIAQSRIKGLNTVSRERDISTHTYLWRSYVSFIYESCLRDAKKALTVAQRSTASRLAARAEVHILRGKLELFRFKILTERALLVRDGDLDVSRRRMLNRKVQQEAKVAAAQMETLEETYIRSRAAMDIDDLKVEKAWFVQNCRERGNKYVGEYDKLAMDLLTESGLAPLSLQEKANIVKAFRFCKLPFDREHQIL